MGTCTTSEGDEGTTRWVFGPAVFTRDEERVVFLTPAKVLRCESCREEIALVRREQRAQRVSRSLCRACSSVGFPSDGVAR